jgi:zinc and cadmium transporter
MVMTYLILFLSVAAGAVVVLMWRPDDRKKIKLVTAFGGAYILSVTSLHLLPEVFGHAEHSHDQGIFPVVGLFLLIGFFVQLILDYLSQGIEHGHAHHHAHDGRIPWGMLVGLCLHAYLEGTPLAVHDHVGPGHGHGLSVESQEALLMGIVMHNIPVSIVFMSLLLHNGLGRAKSIFVMGVFAVMSPLGMLTAGQVERVAQYQQLLMAMVIGIFLHIATTILFETGEDHKFNVKKFLAILAGAGLAIGAAVLIQH